MAHTHFLSAADLAKVTTGSLESRIHSVLDKTVPMVVATEGVDVEDLDVLATFDDGVVVRSGNHLVRYYIDAEAADPVLIKKEECDATAWTSETVGKFCSSEAQRIVDAYLNGEVDSALTRACELVACLPESAEGRALTRVVSALTAPRLWRKVYESRSAQIEAFSGETPDRQYRPVQALFSGLLESELDQRQSALFVDVGHVAFRYELVERSLAEGLLNFNMPQIEGSVIEHHKEFALDLLADVSSLNQCVREVRSSQYSPSVVQLGKLHSALAEHLTQYEVAAHFVNEVFARLTQAAK